MTRGHAREAESTSDVIGVERWAEGLDEQIDFWFRWLRDRGGPWPEDYVRRADPDTTLQPHVARYLEGLPEDTLRILDVGSGPLTVLGKRWHDRTIEITAVDPLADRYAELFERVGLEPLVRPVRGEAEHVSELFPHDFFDLVYAQTCIDHGYDPLLSIRQMLAVAKPGRFVLLEHAIDEGEFVGYAGPHQWNFREEEGRFVIWRPGLHVDAQAALEPDAEVEIELIREARWIRVALRKHDSPMRPAPASVGQQVVDSWSRGLDEETYFWFRWLRDRGGPWSEDYMMRTDPNSQFQPHIRTHLESSSNAHLRILDVGSGPLTILGKRWGDRKLEITAVDPLAERYAELLERFRMDPLVRVMPGEAEQVAGLFPPDSFDLVYARNCLDHGFDPLRSIQQMLEVARPDRFVLLEHAIDEGEHMDYAGPHQWNFGDEGGRFVIWRPGHRIDAHSVLEREADIEIELQPDERYIRVALRKRRPTRRGIPHRFIRRLGLGI